MSEFDSLSDSDWLDLASRASDDNDSISSHDGFGSRPLSRRSSISIDSSHESDVEAWEGFVEESGDELPLQSGMCIVRPVPTGASEFLSTDLTFEDPIHDSTDDQRVKEALDQSMVGTLSASRAGSAGHSSHNSIRDLRLSFPDPLTSSRDQLSNSYTQVPALEDLPIPQEVDATISLSDSFLSSSEQQAESPTILSEASNHEITSPDNVMGLDIILYGSSSPIKWSFVHDLVQKAANFSGDVVLSSFDPNSGAVRTLQLQSSKDKTPLTSITVHDRTSDSTGSIDVDTPDLQDDVMRSSLAIVYLPAATLPVLSIHTAYLPVLVPSTPVTTEFETTSVLHQAAEDDWELLGVPRDRTVFLTSSKRAVMSADALFNVEPLRAFEAIHSVLDGPVRQIKAVSANGVPARAVTLFALVSLMMGVAFNTAFPAPAVAPTGTVKSSSSGSWGMFQQINRTLAVPVSAASAALVTTPLKDLSLTAVTSGVSSLSVHTPQANLLSFASRITSVPPNSQSTPLSVIHMPTSLAVPGPSRQTVGTPDGRQTLSSKGCTTRAVVPTSLIEVKPESSSSSTKLLERKPVLPDLTLSTSHLPNGLAEAIDMSAKFFHNAGKLENGVKDLVDAMDELMNTIQTQTQIVMREGKGKARAFSEEVVSRNDKARGRARELKKMGEEIFNSASVQFFERTEIAKQRAKSIKETFKQSEAWKSYEKVHGDVAGKLKAMEQCAKDKPGWLKRDRGSWGSHWPGCSDKVEVLMNSLPVH